MLMQRTVPGRLRMIWWASCLSGVVAVALSGCGGSTNTTTAGPTAAAHAGNQSNPATDRASLPLPEAMADVSLDPLSKDQKQLAGESLEQVLSRIDVPKEPNEGQRPDTESLMAYGRARQAYEDHDYRRALSELQQAIKLDDRFGAPYEMLGRLYEQLGQQDKMLEAMGDAVKRDPQCVIGLYVLGLSAMDDGKIDRAIELFGRAYKADDRSMDPGMQHLVDFQFGQVLLRSGRLAAGEEAMGPYLRQEGAFDRSTTMARQVYMADLRKDAVLMLLGDAHLRMGDVSGALDRYTQASAEDESIDPSLIARRIYAQLRLGDFEQAEQLAIDTLDNADDSAAALKLAQYTAAHTDQPQRFTKKLTDWYEQSQRSGRMALAVAQVVKPADAEAFLTDHLDRNPTDLNAYRALMKLYGGDAAGRAKIVTTTTKLIAANPDHARRYMTTMLESDLTYDQWDAALKARPDEIRFSAAGWYVRAMIELQAHHTDASAAALAKSLDNDLDFVPAQAATIEKEIANGDPHQALEMIKSSSRKDQPQLQLLKAVALSRQGDTAQAMATLTPLVEQYPQNNEYLLAMAQLQRQGRRYDQAEKSAQQMLNNDPTDEDAYELLFRIYEQDQPDTAKFMQLLAKARATIPTAAVTWRKLARYHMMRNEPDQAEKVLRRLLEHYPKDAAGLRELVGLLARSGRLKDAEQLLTGVLDKDWSNGMAMDLLQQVTRELNDPQVFYARLETLLKRSEPSVDNYRRLAALYDRWHKPQQGIEAINQALALKPQDVVPLYAQLCRLYEQAKQYDKAEQAINQAIATAGDRPELYAIKAWLLHEAKHDDRAVKVMTDAIMRFPPQQANVLRRELARLYTATDQIDLAMAQIDHMVASDPGNAADIYTDQATMLTIKGGSDKLTEKLLLKALAADPDHISANNNLGYQWADEGVNLARAEQMIRKAVTAQPEEAAYLDSMGWVLYKQGKFGQAVLWLHRATQYPGGGDPVVQDHLADAMWRTGQHQQAQKLWSGALEALEKESRQVESHPDDEDAMSPDHAKLLPVLRGKMKALEAGLDPQLAPVPDHVVETVPPTQPQQQVQ